MSKAGRGEGGRKLMTNVKGDASIRSRLGVGYGHFRDDAFTSLLCQMSEIPNSRFSRGIPALRYASFPYFSQTAKGGGESE